MFTPAPDFIRARREAAPLIVAAGLGLAIVACAIALCLVGG